MRLKTRSLTAAAVAAALSLVTTLPADAATTVLTAGHVDVLDVDYTSGALTVQLLDGTASPSVRRAPSTVELDVLAAAKTTVPDNSAYSFLGAPGSTVWILPQTQNANLLWPGRNSTDVASGVFQGNSLTMSLRSVSGAGHPDGVVRPRRRLAGREAARDRLARARELGVRLGGRDVHGEGAAVTH